MEQRVESVLQEYSQWLAEAKQRADWCASPPNNATDISLRLTTVSELESSMHRGNELRDASRRKIDQFKETLDADAVFRLQKRVASNEDEHQSLRRLLDSIRCVTNNS